MRVACHPQQALNLVALLASAHHHQLVAVLLFFQVVKDYQRQDPRARAAAAAATKVVLSPITGEMIPVDQMAEHMRISLIDPRWKQQRDAMLSKIRDTTKASDDEISRNLVGLARSRPDVFGEYSAFWHFVLRAWYDKISRNLVGLARSRPDVFGEASQVDMKGLKRPGFTG